MNAIKIKITSYTTWISFGFLQMKMRIVFDTSNQEQKRLRTGTQYKKRFKINTTKLQQGIEKTLIL